MPAMASLTVAVAALLLSVQGLVAIKWHATDAVHAEWDALKTWLTSSGATVLAVCHGRRCSCNNFFRMPSVLQSVRAIGSAVTYFACSKSGSNKLQEAFTRHSGATVRGVVTREDMQPGEVLLSIPRDLWFAESNIDFDGLHELKKDIDSDDLPVSVALALEAKKGSTSKWAAYINHLPTLQDFESFYVRFASDELLQRFAHLDLAAKVGALQTLDEWERKRFEDWNAKHRHGIEWDEVKLAMARWRTRNYFLSHTHTRVLMPLSDMLNTAPKEELNTAWDDVGDDVFEVQSNASLNAGSELFESYCPHCKNDGLLHGWGIYFEQNPLKMEHKEVTPAFMRSVSQLLEARPAEGMLAPRCKSSTLRETQGPILCAFARLAWETYATSFLQLPSHAVLRAEDTEDGLLQFNIRGMVH